MSLCCTKPLDRAFAPTCGLVAGDLVAISEELSESGEADGLVAAATVGAAGPQTGWAQPWRQLLVRLRQHGSVWVQSLALNIRSSSE